MSYETFNKISVRQDFQIDEIFVGSIIIIEFIMKAIVWWIKKTMLVVYFEFELAWLTGFWSTKKTKLPEIIWMRKDKYAELVFSMKRLPLMLVKQNSTKTASSEYIFRLYLAQNKPPNTARSRNRNKCNFMIVENLEKKKLWKQ